MPPGTDGSVPPFSEFLGELMAAFGGTAALAKAYHDTYKESKSSQAKAQLMLKIGEMLLRNSQHFGTPPKIEEMSDEEMTAVLASFMQQQIAPKTNGDGNNDTAD